MSKHFDHYLAQPDFLRCLFLFLYDEVQEVCFSLNIGISKLTFRTQTVDSRNSCSHARPVSKN